MDELTKQVVHQFKENGTKCGHSNRIFSVKFNPYDQYMILSGGMDNTV